MSYKNNMPNISDSDLEKIAARTNVKGEDGFETQEAAVLAAKARSMTTNRSIYVDRVEDLQAGDKFVVHAHGISKVNWRRLYAFRKGNEVIL